MAKYTISIREELQRYATGDITDLNVLATTSKEVIFKDLITFIKEEYRDYFALGFALRFFNEEIGLETWSLWRMSLANKLVNNYDYINQMYGLLDKQVFANYKVHKVEGEAEQSGNAKTNVDQISNGTTTTDDTNDSRTSQQGTTNGTSSVTSKDKSTSNAKSEDTNRNDSNATTTADGESVSKFSDTPQNGLSGLVNDNYLTNATVQGSDSTTTNVNVSNTTGNGKSESTSESDANSTSTNNDIVSNTVESGMTNNSLSTNSVIGNTTSINEDNRKQKSKSDEITYDWNYEMLMKSSSLLNKVWEIFEPIFFMLY